LVWNFFFTESKVMWVDLMCVVLKTRCTPSRALWTILRKVVTVEERDKKKRRGENERTRENEKRALRNAGRDVSGR
jgi:hypothetical protein